MDAPTYALAGQALAELMKPYEPWRYRTDLYLPTGRSRFAIAKLTSGRVLLAGGDGFGLTNEVVTEVLDLGTRTWTTLASMSTRRTGAKAAPLSDDRALVTGGHTGGSQTATTELYDYATNTWASRASMAKARQDHTADALSGDRVFVAAGYLYPNVLNVTERYDGATNTWTYRSNMAARYLHTSATFGSDRVLTIGGYDTPTGTVMRSAQVYDDVLNTWTAVSSPIYARLAAAAVKLKNDRILVMGGTNSGYLGSTEIYDAAANKWVEGENVLELKSFGGAVPLDENEDTALLIGGYNSNTTPGNKRTVEQYMGGCIKILTSTNRTLQRLLSGIQSWAAAQ